MNKTRLAEKRYRYNVKKMKKIRLSTNKHQKNNIRKLKKLKKLKTILTINYRKQKYNKTTTEKTI